MSFEQAPMQPAAKKKEVGDQNSAIENYFSLIGNHDIGDKRWDEVCDNLTAELNNLRENGDSETLLAMADRLIDNKQYDMLILQDDAFQGVVNEDMLKKYFSDTEGVRYQTVQYLLTSGVLAPEALTNDVIESIEFEDPEKRVGQSIPYAIAEHMNKFPNIDQRRLFEYLFPKKDAAHPFGALALYSNRENLPEISDNEFYDALRDAGIRVTPEYADKFPNIPTESIVSDCIENDPLSLGTSFDHPDVYERMIDEGNEDMVVSATEAYISANNKREVQVGDEIKNIPYTTIGFTDGVKTLTRHCDEIVDTLHEGFCTKYGKEKIHTIPMKSGGKYPIAVTEAVQSVISADDHKDYLRFAKLLETERKLGSLLN